MKKKNILIVFCGMDGTGKSTLANKLVNYLKDKGQDVTFIHGHQYTTVKKSFNAGESQVRRYRLLFSLLTPAAFIDNVLTYYTKYKAILRSKTLICDRYFYDKVARLIFYRIINKFIAKIYLSMLPKPDYAFILTAEPQTVYNRKKEYKIEEYKQFKDNYEFIAQHLKLPLINTENTQEKCFEQILAVIKDNEN